MINYAFQVVGSQDAGQTVNYSNPYSLSVGDQFIASGGNTYVVLSIKGNPPGNTQIQVTGTCAKV